MWSNGRVIGSQWVNLDQSANPSCLLALQYIFVKCINFQPAREKFFMWTQLKKFYGDVPPEKIIDWWGGCGLQCKDFTFFFPLSFILHTFFKVVTLLFIFYLVYMFLDRFDCHFILFIFWQFFVFPLELNFKLAPCIQYCADRS
jgi:hypothetical protein